MSAIYAPYYARKYQIFYETQFIYFNLFLQMLTYLRKHKHKKILCDFIVLLLPCFRQINVV